MQRENWSARTGFILAAVGSAVGLGNIWRFPYVAYDNGGGAFLIPYLVALFTAALPLLFLDYVVGQKYKGAPPAAYRQMAKGAEAVGWWQALVCVVIVMYYASVLGWAGDYVLFSVTQAWGDNPQGFFFESYLMASDGIDWQFVPRLFVGLCVVWAMALVIMLGGVKKGVELANKVALPLLMVVFIMLCARAVTLPGAALGLNAFFEPNWQAMAHPSVWLAAFGHVFFSLSVGFGIMVTYASYLGKNANLTGSGLTVAFANSSFEILAGIGVFAAIGFMAQASGQDVSEVAGSGPGLAFITFPQIISTMGTSGALVGVLFFASLVFAGITSMVSILEVPIASLQDKLSWGRTRAVLTVVLPTSVSSIFLFSTVNAITFVDIMDAFANNIGVVLGAFLSIIWVSWFHRHLLDEFVTHINRISSVKVGSIWRVLLTLVTPFALVCTLALTLKDLLTQGYGDYPFLVQLIVGWGVVVFCAVGALVFTHLNKDKS